jgi:hypothetical protein
VNVAKLFILMVIAGGAGGGLGSIVGNAFGRGGLFAGGVVGGAAFVVAAGYLAAGRHWIPARQRLWVIAGGLVGFGLACVVALSTLGSPIGPLLSTLLVGSGAVLGMVLGSSPHASGNAHTQS